MLQGCAFAEPCSFEFIEPAQRSSTALPSHVILRKYTVPPLPGTQMRACALHASQHSCAVYTLKDIPQFSEPPLKPACCVGWHDGSAWYESRGGGDDASGGGGGGDVSGGGGDTSGGGGGERISDANVRISDASVRNSEIAAVRFAARSERRRRWPWMRSSATDAAATRSHRHLFAMERDGRGHKDALGCPQPGKLAPTAPT